MRTSIVVPAAPVIDLPRAKLHCKLTGTARDAEVLDAIETARAWVQEDLCAAVGEQTLAFTFDTWSGSGRVPFEVSTVVSVKSGADEVPYSRVGEVFTVNASAPIVITAVVGYTPVLLPGPIKSAMLLLIKDLIDNQQSQVDTALYENHSFKALLWPYSRRVPL